MKLLVLFFLLVGPLPGFSEYRLWSDKKGNCIEAELLDSNPAQVSVRDKNGKVFKFHPTKLSAADQNYLKTAFPPELEIEFSKIQDRQKHNYSYSAEVLMSGSVVVKPTRRTEYTQSMKSILIMVGENQRDHSVVILDRVEKMFDFKHGQEFELKGVTFKMYEDKYDNSYGTKYKGFLCVVLDSADQPIEIKASRKEYEALYAKIIKLKTGASCTKDFDPKDRVRSY